MGEKDVLVAGRYRLVRRIGLGGMGTVWEARDERLRRTVAVKLLHTPPGTSQADAQLAKDRAMREARITARLHHPHAVPIFDVVEHEGQPCLVMQYLPSKTLQEVLAQSGVLPLDEVALVGAEIASALAAAHAAGIVHRDVKPGNILILDDGSARITDFGISRAMGDSTLTSTGMVTGTPAYLAPEVARGGNSSPASDVFSLGATLYAAIEGTPPFGMSDNPMALLHRVASEDPKVPDHAGPLTPLLLDMLAGRPEDRPTMSEVARSFETLDLTSSRPTPEATQVLRSETQRLPVGRPTTVGAAPAMRRSRRGLAVAGAIAALAVVAWLGLNMITAPVGDAPTARSVKGTSSAPPVSQSASSTAPTTPASKRATTSKPRPSTTARTPTSTPTSTPKITPVAGRPTRSDLVRAITDYYALMPADIDTGYSLLTARYRSTTAGSKQTYASFWGSIDRVATRDVTASLPGTVQATITYWFQDGRVVVERTAYGLVDDDGTLKIDSSRVLSSQTL